MIGRASRRTAVAFLALQVAVAAPAAAQGVPVYDASNVAQAIQQVTHMVEQIALMQQQLNSITGPRRPNKKRRRCLCRLVAFFRQ